ncbi:MAG: hypothetical protein FJ096_00455 [Deltaproteobacteria bacterium]|nr:hypothetical protein [Deltaproteobacteria bacterium]
MRRPCLPLLLVLVTLGATAAGDDAPSPSAQPSADVPLADLPLADLPTMPPVDRGAPKAAAAQTLEARLDQLLAVRASHPVSPKVDFAFLTSELDEDVVPAIAQRMEQIRRSIDGGGASGMLERARKLGAKSLGRGKRSKKGEEAKGPPEPEGDWLQFALAVDKRDSAAWRDLVQIYGMLRMLEAVGTTSAVRELIGAYSYFGELVRIDLQRSLERLKDRAVPALIEAREHDAKKVRDWAKRLLDGMGRAIPGEAIATTDPVVIADVLLAFGRVKDLDAARVILSFVANDRLQLRKAARQAIVAIGEPAVWHLKDAYESATGEKPPRAWDHRRLAQELFRLHDRSRMTAVYELMTQGQEHARKGEHANAVATFDQVLARSPLFERRKEMVPSYVAHAAQLEKDEKLAEALLALRKARRLDPEAPDRAKVDSRIAFLEGRQLVDRGTPDPFIFKKAVELDPDNRDARELLVSLEDRTVRVERATKRYLAAGAIGLGAIGAMIWLARRRDEPREKDEVGPRVAAPPEEPNDEPTSDDPSELGSMDEVPVEAGRMTEADLDLGGEDAAEQRTANDASGVTATTESTRITALGPVTTSLPHDRTSDAAEAPRDTTNDEADGTGTRAPSPSA